MKLEQRLSVPTSAGKLWDLLMDVARVGRCFPGVEQVTPLDDYSYQGVIRVRVGPVILNMSGTIVMLEQDAGSWHASLRLEGTDRKIGGAVNGTMYMDLRELSPEETELVISGDVSFLGKLGELGQPVIRRKADSVIRDFAENLRQEAAAL